MGSPGTARSTFSRAVSWAVVVAVTAADYFIARVINHDGKTFDIPTVLELALLLIVSCSVAAGILLLLRPARVGKNHPR